LNAASRRASTASFNKTVVCVHVFSTVGFQKEKSRKTSGTPPAVSCASLAA
jgi:hypothetical protein